MEMPVPRNSPTSGKPSALPRAGLNDADKVTPSDRASRSVAGVTAAGGTRTRLPSRTTTAPWPSSRNVNCAAEAESSG